MRAQLENLIPRDRPVDIPPAVSIFPTHPLPENPVSASSRRRAFALPRLAATFVPLLLGALTVAAPVQAQESGALPVTKVPAAASSDSAAAVATVNQLHALLERGDSAGVLALLAPDVVVLESGGFEDRAEFRSHHLPADIAFARAVKSDRTLRSVQVAGDAAWVASTSVAQGEFRGRAINSAGAELIVLRRAADGWKIAAIHWSSRARRG